LLYLNKKYTKNEIERADKAGVEWFDKEAESKVLAEIETSPDKGDERTIRKGYEGIPGEE